MPFLEPHPWREGDATLLDGARIVGRCEGIRAEDNARFHGLVVEPAHKLLCDKLGCMPECLSGRRYAAYWHRGQFHVEEMPKEGDKFVCDTCQSSGIVGVDGPLYGNDRDPRLASVSRCRSCTTQVG